MKSLVHFKWAFVPLLYIFLGVLTTNTLSSQELLQENFDTAPLGAPPSGWTQFGDGNVDPGQSCMGNSFRMNLYGNNTISNLTSPTINRGNIPGKVMITFDYRLADWNNNNQLTGDGNVGLSINDGALFPWNQSISFTNGCRKQSFSLTTAEVPLNSDFTFTFIGSWTSGDWAFVVDNIRVWILNDECETAILIPQTSSPSGVTDQPTSGSYFAATQSLPNCDGFANNDVWYEFVATEEAVSIAVIGQDIAAGLYAGSCGILTSLACQGVMLGNVFFDYFGTTVGETYYVRVHSYTEGAASVDAGEFQIQIGTPLVINDECAAAVNLNQSTTRSAFLFNATNSSLAEATSSQAACTGTSNDDVWFSFVADTRAVDIAVEAGDVVVELFSGNCGSLMSLACIDGSSSNEAFRYDGTIIGDTYFIRVYSFDAIPLSGVAANFRIEVGTPSLINDECVSAQIISQSSSTSCGTNFIMGSVENATESQTACTGTANDDVWYEFMATNTDFSVFLESGDFVVELFEGSCGSLVTLDCEDGIAVNETFDYSGATIGATYFLRVHSFGNTALTGTAAEFGICVFTTPPAPGNDDCANAETLFPSGDDNCGGLTSGTTNGANRTEPDPRCPGINGWESVWYNFTASRTEHFITLSDVNILNGGANDLSSFEIFSGNCGALTRIQCSGQLGGSDPGAISVSGLTVGETYLIRVIPVNPFHTIDFNICITSPCPDLPTNLQVGSLTSTTAALSHIYELSVSRTFVVVLPGDDPVNDAVFSETLLQGNTTATGLSPGTDYEYYVLTNCGGLEVTGPVSFSTPPPAPANDECINAQIIAQSSSTSCGTSFTMGSVENATQSQTACTGTANDDVWYEFVATSADFSVYLESGDFVVELFEGSCGNLTSLVCRDLFGIDEAFSYSGASSGATYYLRVYSFGNTALTATAAEFGICVYTTPPAPLNNDCADATDLLVSNSENCTIPTVGSTNGASRSESEPLCVGVNGPVSVWYSFTATAAEHIVTLSNVGLVNGNDNDISSFEVFSGNCGTLTNIMCSGQLGGSNPAPVTVNNLVIGNSYLLRVVPVNPHHNINFDICITTPCPALATGLAVNNITSSTAALSISNAAGPERDFIVVPSGFDVTDIANYAYFTTSLGNSVSASGLLPNTDYDFYVQSCGATQTAGPIAFTTLEMTFCGSSLYDDGGIGGEYSNDLDQVITLCPQSGSGDKLSLQFSLFDFETDGATGCFDGIIIYDGMDTNASIISSPSSSTDMWCWDRDNATGSGDLLNTLIFNNNASGCFTIRIQSDATFTGDGFAIEVICGDNSAIAFETVETVPAAAGQVTADRAVLNAESGFIYYIDDNEAGGALLGLKLANTDAIVPINGVSINANNSATNLGLNGCMAPYTNQADWWVSGRTWDVTATQQPTGPVEVSFLYKNADFETLANSSGFAGINHTNLTHFKINGGDEEDLSAPGNDCHDLVNPVNYQEFDQGEFFHFDFDGPVLDNNAAFYTVNEFSGGGFGVGSNFMGSLPIELLSFTGEVQEHVNRLEWISAQEENTEVHLIERSADGRDWQTIGQLAAAGNSQEVISYEFIDHAPLSRAFYRIQTIDLDGSSSTSAILELNRQKEGTLQLGYPAPSPTTGPFFIDISPATNSQIIDLRILGASGQLRQQQQLEISEGGSQLTFDLSELPAGLYWLVVTDERGERKSRPVFKR